MLTAGETISSGIQYALNISSDSNQWKDPYLRSRCRFYLRDVMARSYTFAPHWFRLADGTVAITAGAGVGATPADFGSFGTQGLVFLQATPPWPMDYVEPLELKAMVTTDPTQGPQPTHYTLSGQETDGRARIAVWRVNAPAVTLLLKNYVRRSPEPIDVPTPPTAAASGAGALTGSYKWKLAYVHAGGETEGGIETAALTLAANQALLTNIPISPVRSVTSIKVYRTVAGGLDFKLSGSVSNKPGITYTDNVADGSLGAEALAPAGAVTGTEVFPHDFHESILWGGLVAKLARSQGDMRDAKFWAEWEDTNKRLWADQKQGRNVGKLMPAYGQGGFGARAPRYRLLT